MAAPAPVAIGWSLAMNSAPRQVTNSTMNIQNDQ